MPVALLLILGALAGPAAGATADPSFEHQTIAEIEIGYGVALGDVDGDGRSDLFLADRRQFAWYRNPGRQGESWERHVAVADLTERDNVCLAVRDVDGDGRVEVAVGARWNPGETTDASASGSVHFLRRPEDPRQAWEPIELPNEPTVHRMRWMRTGEDVYQLIVAPLHGRGNVNGAGAGARILAYSMPDDPRRPWPTTVIDESMHLTHNIDIVESGEVEALLIAGREGVHRATWSRDGSWSIEALGRLGAAAGEVRGRKTTTGVLAATVEPMHGNQVVAYEGSDFASCTRLVLAEDYRQGHALVVADLLGAPTPQVVAGWRQRNAKGRVGLELFAPIDVDGKRAWERHLIDDNGMACEDLAVGDLDGDGRLDIVAAGRATRNLKIYWNRTGLVGDDDRGPQQGTGFKIGEVTHESVIVWTRLTQESIEELAAARNEAVPGHDGEVRVVLTAAGQEEQSTTWRSAAAEHDHCVQHSIAVQPSTAYEVRVEARAGADSPISSTLTGGFTSAPPLDVEASVSFVVVTGQAFHRRDDPAKGHRIYPRMRELQPSFFVHTGDIIYYDKPDPVAQTLRDARLHWHRMYSLPNQREFHRFIPSYFMKDDHDTLKDDCWPGQRLGDLTWEQGLATFREQVPMGSHTFRTVRWGRDLQLWFVEGRDFRSSNRADDGPGKTIWGTQQMAWFERTLRESDATFRVLVSPTPIVGPDRKQKSDNHANRTFAHEGQRLRRLLSGQRDVVVVCGDRHWQYVSVDPETGLREFSCGPTTDAHAGGFSGKPREEHEFLRVKGGFLSVSVERIEGVASATFRHHAVDGTVQHTDVRRRRSTPR